MFPGKRKANVEIVYHKKDKYIPHRLTKSFLSEHSKILLKFEENTTKKITQISAQPARETDQ